MKTTSLLSLAAHTAHTAAQDSLLFSAHNGSGFDRTLSGSSGLPLADAQVLYHDPHVAQVAATAWAGGRELHGVALDEAVTSRRG